MAKPKGLFPVRNGELGTGRGPIMPWLTGKASITPILVPPDDLPSVTYRKFPEGVSARFIACEPMGVVGPDGCATGASWPVLESMEKTEISNEPEFTTYKKLPALSIASNVGDVPALVLGVTSVSAPVLEIVYSEMLLLPELAAYKYFPD